MSTCSPNTDPSTIHHGRAGYVEDGKVLALGPGALSDNVLRMGYNAPYKELVVQFYSRRNWRYRYIGVSKTLWDSAVRAEHPWSTVLWPIVKTLPCLVNRNVRSNDIYFKLDCGFDAEGRIDREFSSNELRDQAKGRTREIRSEVRARRKKNLNIEHARKRQAARVRKSLREAEVSGLSYKNGTLTVKFQKGRDRVYRGVPQRDWDESVDSPNPWRDVLWERVRRIPPS